MNICVFGLWHLGCVTAACVSQRFPTIGLDPEPKTVADLLNGRPPLFEPGLEDLIRSGREHRMLDFTSDRAAALADADVVWVALDTPVDENDNADVRYVEGQVVSLFPHLRAGTVVLISSQMPVGSTTRIAAAYRQAYPEGIVHFAYSPENLRLGRALEVFRNPGRIVIGVSGSGARERLTPLLEPFCQNLLWMSVQSAEMVKHALNAFLANSVVFINEIASICEGVDADAKEVSAGLKSDERIGQRAYLGAGGPFAGGTLARDVAFLNAAAGELHLSVPLLESIRRSNDQHKNWARRKLVSLLGNLRGKTVAVLGLTYKPGTDTLRRSTAVELCTWAGQQGAKVRAFDPAVRQLPASLRDSIELAPSAIDAIAAADAVVIATEWPDFRQIDRDSFVEKMRTPIVIDANRFLEKSLQPSPPLQYVAVGMRAAAA